MEEISIVDRISSMLDPSGFPDFSVAIKLYKKPVVLHSGDLLFIWKFSKKNPLSMPRATERVYKTHTERMGQNIWSSVPNILVAQLNPASNSEDIVLRNVSPPGQYLSFLVSICCLDSSTFILFRSRSLCPKLKNPFQHDCQKGSCKSC